MNEQSTKIRNFRDLEIWQKGKQIALEIYQATKSFPDEEKFGLTSQMRRSSVSISSNIAEGFNRWHNKEYKQFLFIAFGSCAELETQLEIAKDLELISNDKYVTLQREIEAESKMIRSLINKLN